MTNFRFAWKPGDASDRIGRLVMVVGDEVDELYDVSVLEAQLHQPGLLTKLLDQAHRLDPPPAFMHTTPVTLWSTVPSDPTDPRDRFARLLTAARETTTWFYEHESTEDVTDEMKALLHELEEAQQAWEP